MAGRRFLRDHVPVAAHTLWNHNIQYHPLIIAALPQECHQVLDVGCGEGVLARELSGVARHVIAIDRDAPTIALAKKQTSAANVDYVLDDFLVHPFEPQSFDAVVSIAALHHIGTSAALLRMQQLLRPGGTLAVVGLARSRRRADLMLNLAGVVADRLHKVTKTYWETSAPKIWPPAETYRQTRQAAETVLPGARYRRRLLWRYSITWTKPTERY
jgi:2-polyprenyl-3-methyl-5-hydroxy-6-metoxy-1,4-benzoquinol methylase